LVAKIHLWRESWGGGGTGSPCGERGWPSLGVSKEIAKKPERRNRRCARTAGKIESDVESVHKRASPKGKEKRETTKQQKKEKKEDLAWRTPAKEEWLQTCPSASTPKRGKIRIENPEKFG